ncbi:PF14022 family protein [Leptospira yanagawae serovar Saopaulo str. Sao Paulo = ATCC 700523]|uniref:PF14022 family protein n=1 Tax=Leptospira yanagawae serovar Saopaulo str. Sao Paulo = ATCC 700523 TaxID=1249483 RepID=A0A5E8HHH7_9LEPT|nr:DUF4238 domain-containing protein [Leptospira yanagawae]EOQ90372.1 PF14022 family protein [Leptospira yanagawae serovar Saopaulo str. Sao Paulo = ATCC 700523]
MGQDQHIVPQIYLNNFVDNTSPFPTKPLNIFDKLEQKFLKRAPINFLALNHIYSFTIDSEKKDNSLEKYLSKIETKFSGAVRRLITNIDKSKNSATLYIDIEDKKIFAYFLIWQIKRTILFLNTIENGLDEEFHKNGLGIPKLPDGKPSPELRNYTLYVLSELGENTQMNFLDIFMKKNLIVTIIPENFGTGFITSDNPVLISNQYGKGGIALEDTQISIPLTPKIGISFFKTGKSIIKFNQIKKDEIRKSNISLAKNAHKYIISPSEEQLKRICKNI